jgi:hypothetical protein
MNTLVFSFLNVNPAVTVSYQGLGSGAGSFSAIMVSRTFRRSAVWSSDLYHMQLFITWN